MRRIILAVVTIFVFAEFSIAQDDPNLADFTQDGVVNLLDFAILASSLQMNQMDSNWCEICDLYKDGEINNSDLEKFLNAWLYHQDILLEIYSDGWGNLLKTMTLQKDGPATIWVYEQYPYFDPPLYYIYASRSGAYTEVYYCQIGETINVDLDSIKEDKFNGTIFVTQTWFHPGYVRNWDVRVKDETNTTIVTQFQTDSQGRFAIDLSLGSYYFEFTGDYPDDIYSQKVDVDGHYKDLFFSAHMQALKPNIYIYPEQTTVLDVNIVFPHGGTVTTSIPEYRNGWHITAEPSGVIDDEYSYLFYESIQSDYGQYSAGWVIERDDLEQFFRSNMVQTGFSDQEINDFIEYWVPRLKEYPYYAIYPQYKDQLNEMIQLKFSIEPTNLIRVIYSLRGLEADAITLETPVIPAFSRNGFTVAEWGVILK